MLPNEFRGVYTGPCGQQVDLQLSLMGDTTHGKFGDHFVAITYSELSEPYPVTPLPEPGLWALLVLLPVVWWLGGRHSAQQNAPSTSTAP